MFDTIVAPIMLYGSEVFAWNQKMLNYDGIACQFYRKMIGLQPGTASSALEVLLQKEKISKKAVTRALVYWRKIASKKEDSLVKEAWSYLRESERSDTFSWSREVEAELKSLNLEYAWKNPEAISINKFKKIVKQKVKQSSLDKSLAEWQSLPSYRYFNDLLKVELRHKIIMKFEFSCRRRLYIKVLLNQFEEHVNREDGIKICKMCNELVDKRTAIHRIFDCTGLARLRDTANEQEWFMNIASNDHEVNQTKDILLKLEGDCGKFLIPFIKVY